MIISYKRSIDQFKCFCILPVFRADTGKMIKALRLRFRTPCCFEKGVIRLFIFTEQFIGNAKIIIAFTVVRIRIAPSLLFDCLFKIWNTFYNLSVSQKEQTICIVKTNICFISFQSLKVIVRRIIGCMSILFKMLTCKIQFFERLYILRLVKRLWNRLLCFNIFFIFTQQSAAVITNTNAIII